MDSEFLPCLLRIGENIKKYRLLLLEKDKVTIGRSPEVTYCLLSVMISRCHCILKRNPDSTWTITDNKSLNGVFVNGEQLVALKPRTLTEGDTIQLGISTSPSKQPEFVYKFHSSIKIKRRRPKSSTDGDEPQSKRLKSQHSEDDGKNKSTQPESDCREQPESDCQAQPESDCQAQPESDCQAQPDSDYHVSSSQPDLEGVKDIPGRLCDQVDPGRLCDQVDPGRLCDQVDPGRLCDQVDPGRRCDQVDPGRPCDQVDPGRLCDQVDSGRLCDQVDPGRPCDQVDPGRPCDQVDPGRLCDQVDPGRLCDQVDPGRRCDQVDGRSPYKKYRDELRVSEERQAEEMRRIQEQMEEMQRQLQAKEQEQLRMLEELSKEKEEREAQAVTLGELRQQEERLRQEMVQKQEALLKEKEETERRIRAELEKQLKRREHELIDYLQVQRESLLSEKQRVEERLQNEMAKALEEKDKQLETELLQQKERLEKVLEKKELNQRVLASQLQDTRAESERQRESVLQARQDVLANFAQLMETELQCSICNELFVQATSLNCSHAFCALCIANWMKRKKECPICRAPVTSHMRSIVLDSYIDAMAAHLSDEMKQSRKELVQARKEEQAKFDEENKAELPGTSGVRGRGRGRVRGTGSRVRGTGSRVRGSGSRQVPRPIVVESDDSEVDDDSEDGSDHGSEHGSDSDSSISGARGHWANGCPLT